MLIFFFPLPRPFSRLVDGFRSVHFDFITNRKNPGTRLPSRHKTAGLGVAFTPRPQSREPIWQSRRRRPTRMTQTSRGGNDIPVRRCERSHSLTDSGEWKPMRILTGNDWNILFCFVFSEGPARKKKKKRRWAAVHFHLALVCGRVNVCMRTHVGGHTVYTRRHV